MGRDKALLPFRGTTLAGHVAFRVGEVASKVRILGDPMRQWGWGLRFGRTMSGVRAEWEGC